MFALTASGSVYNPIYNKWEFDWANSGADGSTCCEDLCCGYEPDCIITIYELANWLIEKCGHAPIFLDAWDCGNCIPA